MMKNPPNPNLPEGAKAIDDANRKKSAKISVGIVSLGACAITEPDSGFPLGGSELQLYLLARKLAAQSGFDVTLYVADLGQGEREESGVLIRPLVKMGQDLRLTFGRSLTIVRRLVRAKHDVYVTRSASGLNGLVSTAAGFAAGRHVHMCAGETDFVWDPDTGLSARAWRLHQKAMRHASLVTCQTHKQLDQLREVYGREGALVPNLAPPLPSGIDASQPREGALWVGRDIDCKQPEMFVDLARRLPEWKFTMVCQPQPGRDLKRLKTEAPANLDFIAGMGFSESAKLFSRHQVLVSTSTAEGFPNTFLQAAAAGTPIVSLSVDPDGLIARHKAGFVCDGSFDRLIEHTSGLLEDTETWQTHHEGAVGWAQELEKDEVRVVEVLRELVPAARRGEVGRGPRKRGVWWWTRLALVAAMLVGLVIIAKPDSIWEALKGADYLWVLAAMPVTFAAALLDATKLYFLIKPHGFRAGWLSVLRTNLVVNFVSLFLPGTVGGGAVAWYRLSRPDRIPAQTFTALSLNIVIKLVAICAAGFGALALDVGASGTYRLLTIPLLVGACLPLAALCLMLWTGISSWMKRIHMRALTGIMPGRMHDAVRKIFESLETYRTARAAVVLALAAGLARRLITTFSPMLCLYAVGEPIGYFRILWIMCAVELASMLPFTMAGFGLPQVSHVELLRVCQIGRGAALAAHVINWVALLPVYLTGAGILFAESLGRNSRGADQE